MPFTSKAQMKKCFALKNRGQGKGWNCEEWAHKTKSIKKLPEKKGSAQIIAELEKQARSLPELLGIRAAVTALSFVRVTK